MINELEICIQASASSSLPSKSNFTTSDILSNFLASEIFAVEEKMLKQ